MKYVVHFGRRTFASLKIRNYRLYFIGQAISLCGTWMQTIAQDWLVLKLSGSGTMLGLVTALQFLPVLFFGPLGGVVADRFPKRKILYVTQSSAGLLALVLGLLVVTGAVRLWMLFILAPLLGLVNTVDNPTRQTFVFEMVGEDALNNAVTLNSTEVNLARVIGPSIAGILIATVGLGACFLINAISYVPVLVMLCMMRASELHQAPLIERARGQLREGFSYVWHTPLLRDTLIMMGIIGTLSYEFSVVLPLLAQFTFHGNASSYAALTASMGIGSVLGGLVTAGRKKVAPQLLIRASFLFGIALFLAAIVPSLFLEVLVMIVIGIFSINFISLGNTTLQLESKPEMRGRVMALWAVAFLGSTPIGGPIIGWIGEHAGPRWGLVIGGLAAVIAAGIGVVSLRREKQRVIATSVKLRPEETAAVENV